jgi:hypothetical protein
MLQPVVATKCSFVAYVARILSICIFQLDLIEA